MRLANLAVVGAGIGGCSAAYFARKYLPGLNLTIYDARDRTGGRILSSNATGATLELGAAFFNGFNKTLLGIVEVEGLNFVPVEDRKDFAVWNGSEFVFRSNKQSFSTTLRLLARYGLSLTRSFLLLRKVKEQVARLYREQHESPADMGEIFESTRLDEWHKKPFSEALIDRGIGQAFIDEIVSPITRAIYSQNADLGGFAGISSLIGVYSGTTYRLAEGNSALPARLAEAAKATVKLGQKVDVIEKTSNGTYRVYAGEDVTVFDGVIIATPLELAAVKFDGLSVQDWLPQTYQAVYKSVMRGVFDPDYFGLENSADPPATVLTTKDSGPITQYSIHKARDGQSLVMISSPEPLNHNAFNGLFKDEGVRVLEHCWKAAYPMFRPLTRLPPTCIGERLMYINGIESAVSSMETSALSALNAVRMLDQEQSGFST